MSAGWTMLGKVIRGKRKCAVGRRQGEPRASSGSTEGTGGSEPVQRRRCEEKGNGDDIGQGRGGGLRDATRPTNREAAIGEWRRKAAGGKGPRYTR